MDKSYLYFHIYQTINLYSLNMFKAVFCVSILYNICIYVPGYINSILYPVYYVQCMYYNKHCYSYQ